MTPQVGDIWFWKSKLEGSLDEYWLIIKLPDVAMCLCGPESGDIDEITVSTEPSRWEKIA